MPCNLIAEASHWAETAFPAIDWARSASASATALGLVAAAEFGDKSQLVCMTLAARHRHWPVLAGAVAAFALLNGMAVLFGAAVGHWLPPAVVAGAVAVLFLAFGIRSLLAGDGEDADAVVERPGHGIFLTTFLMIFLAEFGDKTQLTVAGLASAEPPNAVWVGATLALSLTSALGIWAGRALLQKIPERTMHRVAGALFLGFAAVAAYEAGLGALGAAWLQRWGADQAPQ
jgi:putative Ca2+/H+ antiporter (TMEM165/GDT1 family)